jgi:pyruvate formate lyase activating enzyme
MDLIFIDIKHMDDEIHNFYTGKSNKLILENIKMIGQLGLDTIIRIPVIEGVNADDKNILETSRFVFKNIKNPKIELLPYHFFGDEKYQDLKRRIPSREFKTPSDERMEELYNLVKNQGVQIVKF